MRRIPRRIVRRKVASSVSRLIEASLNVLSEDPSLGEKYLRKALRLCERYRVRRPFLLRRLYCRKCKKPIFPGRTSRFRICRGKKGHLSITCLLCGSVARIPLKRVSSRDLVGSEGMLAKQYR